jgi:hypothetical protein
MRPYSAGMSQVSYSVREQGGGGPVIELSDMISELRRELDQAIEAGRDERLRFELGPVEVEVTVGLDRKGGAGAKVRFWVVELGADAEVARSSLQRIKLTLKPRLAGSDAPPLVSGPERPGER